MAPIGWIKYARRPSMALEMVLIYWHLCPSLCKLFPCPSMGVACSLKSSFGLCLFCNHPFKLSSACQLGHPFLHGRVVLHLMWVCLMIFAIVLTSSGLAVFYYGFSCTFKLWWMSQVLCSCCLSLPYLGGLVWPFDPPNFFLCSVFYSHFLGSTRAYSVSSTLAKYFVNPIHKISQGGRGFSRHFSHKRVAWPDST